MRKIVLILATLLATSSSFAVTFEKENFEQDGCKLKFPKMVDGNKANRDIFNNKILKEKKSVIDKIKKNKKLSYEYSTDYKVYRSNKGITTILLQVDETLKGGRDTAIKGISVDDKTGKIVNLDSYIGENGKRKIITFIKNEVKKDKAKTKYFHDGTPITLKKATIYLEDDDIVVKYPLGEIAPYSSGIPTFRFKINDILKK